MSDRAGTSYGDSGVTWVDRFGVWLSQRAILRMAPNRNDLTAIEFGCGYHATQLLALKHRLSSGVGVDFRFAPELKNIPNFRFIEGTLESTVGGFAPESFDLVLLISVLEHIRDPDQAIKSAAGLLRPGGQLVINVPTWRGKTFLEFSAFKLGLSPKVEMDDHKMYYDKRDLWPKLIAGGFFPSNVRLKYHKFGLNLFAIATKR